MTACPVLPHCTPVMSGIAEPPGLAMMQAPAGEVIVVAFQFGSAAATEHSEQEGHAYYAGCYLTAVGETGVMSHTVANSMRGQPSRSKMPLCCRTDRDVSLTQPCHGRFNRRLGVALSIWSAAVGELSLMVGDRAWP